MRTAAMVTELPAGSGWYLGGYPYGLEPLTLPSPGVTDDDRGFPIPDSRSQQDYADACRRIRHAGQARGSIRPADGESTDELYWFRWITGHQVSFVIWRLMAQTLYEIRARRIAQPEAVRSLCHCVRGYTAMLLYTSSCPRRSYQELIRPSMYRQHRGFSGGWAPDYRPVRDVFQGRPLAGIGGRESRELHRAIDLCRAVHEGIGVKLVAGDRSLLQKSAASRRTHEIRLPDMRLLGVLFDNYFMTLRAPVSWPDIVGQALRRLVAVTDDVMMNGLHPPGYAKERPPQLASAEILDVESNLAMACLNVARCVVALITGERGPDSPAWRMHSGDAS